MTFVATFVAAFVATFIAAFVATFVAAFVATFVAAFVAAFVATLIAAFVGQDRANLQPARIKAALKAATYSPSASLQSAYRSRG
jgi:hypothetical protein